MVDVKARNFLFGDQAGELTEELELSISSLFPDSKFWVKT